MRPLTKLLTIAALAALVGCGRTELIAPLDDASVDLPGADADADVIDEDVVDDDVPIGPDTGCTTNAQCAGDPRGPVCDVTTGRCVECVSPSDCPSPGFTCQSNRCVRTDSCNGGPLCAAGLACCRSGCADTANDRNNCGACDGVCNALETCVRGICVRQPGCPIGCPPGATCCGDTCADTASDRSNCGTCGNACRAGSSCVRGACVADPACGGGAPCGVGSSCCNDRCVDTLSDPAHCGGCGTACAAGSACAMGRCVGLPECGLGRLCPDPAAQVCCAGSCRELRSDPTNCGACGVTCGPDQRCVMARCLGGACPGGCAMGQACCGDRCADVLNDPANCGMCGNACPAGTRCVAGACAGGCGGAGPCPAGTACCADRCANVASDPSNCGACGRSCPEGQVCVGGRCGAAGCFPGCTPGLTCCGTGCANPQTDPRNCGGCGVVCTVGTTCVAGRCQAPGCGAGPACASGQTCCNNACADVSSDPSNCGGCGRLCRPGTMCAGGVCTVPPVGCGGGPPCPTGQSCCGDACVNVGSDVNHCGMCGRACPTPPNTTVVCAAGTCGVRGCVPGTADCNGTVADGCEVFTATDTNHCGRCNNRCAAGSSCEMGACRAGPSTGMDGAFNPVVNPTFLRPGVHNFTTINVPAGVVVYVAGSGGTAESGTLDLRATGDVTIDGTIDVSGGPGSQSTITSRSTRQGRAGAGGFTGDPRTATPGPACEWVGGVSGGNGRGTLGTTGTCRVGSSSVCITDNATQLIFASPVAQFGGGGGVFTGFRAYGAGGGGFAGGGPGALGALFMGQQDCTGASGGGGATAGRGGSAGAGRGAYDGRNGALGQTQCDGASIGRPGIPAAWVGGGGGGSIGSAAAGDLAVDTTFYPGSGGGGGSADYLNRPAFGGTSGGGGGGGALRVWSQTRITINGRVLANGGDGGDSYIGTNRAAGCDPQPGAAGGGGSGGVIFLRAPAVTTGVRARVSAAGGLGGVGSLYATGGGGGEGGPGRIRLSVNSATCTLGGTFVPALASGCAATPAPGTLGRAYVASYPN
jgi:hypothetical protein